MVEERVKVMKNFLLELAGIPLSEDTLFPYLSVTKHGICYLGNTRSIIYKNLETYKLGADKFSYDVFPDVMCHSGNLFKAKPKTRKGFDPLMACVDTFFNKVVVLENGQ